MSGQTRFCILFALLAAVLWVWGAVLIGQDHWASGWLLVATGLIVYAQAWNVALWDNPRLRGEVGAVS